MKRFYGLLTVLLSASLLIVGCGKKEAPTTSYRETANRVVTHAYFSPRGGCTKAIVEQIKRSHKTIDIAIYSFTSKKIAKALIDAHRRGVRVRVIIDYGNGKSRYCVGPLLEKEGIEVRYKKGSGGGLMHNKYAVYDGKVVSTGSFNWTANAEKRNDENLVVIENDPSLVKAYEANFRKLWRLAGLTN
ncbi:phospholipase D family nuclease [Thermovibrio ammonificans]|uniref:phospholipase D n=1 Tax=Thermovibrio ammonificans (strain DSM 15698 / JCM 12110 / HB-1) TaxID=648996 RepID=E8T638_THEA1|nr:phospholipase D family protein [Thermovibrio ammonificans]ADU96622.1 phospholipase D/Transphosphatidylase [Thermovibrio ammonificans HB-1]